jgi:DNA-directed RNA polymerase I subunit RPA49
MDQSKKRKRSEKDGGGRSMPAHASVRVKHLTPEETQLGPIVASTPGLSAPEDITFTPYRRIVLSRATEKKRRQILLQSSQHGRLDYIAQEEQAAGNMKHYIAVYDAHAGKFTMTECHKVTLRGTLRPTQEELDEEAALRDRATYATQRMNLGQEFGTKKAKKVIADQTVNAINQRRPGETAPPVDAAQQAVLDSLNLKTEGMATAEERQTEADRSKPRPNDNKNATTPAEVYPIERIVPTDDLALMKVADWQMAAKKAENVKLTKRYVAHRLQKAGTTRDTTNLKLLKYMNIMLTWFDALESRRDTKKVPFQDKLREKVDAPGAILGSLRKHFTDGQYVGP